MHLVKSLLLVLVLMLVSLSALAKAPKDNAVECLASAMLMEAVDQPLIGREAVAMVVLNRAKFEIGKICSVVKARKQFSWYKGGSVKTYRSRDARRIQVTFEAMDFLVFYKQSAVYKNPRLRHATYFHATYVSPNWRGSACNPVRVKDHVFYAQCNRKV